ncbi:hypothetical protein D3C72_2031500 [compost metagenome]
MAEQNDDKAGVVAHAPTESRSGPERQADSKAEQEVAGEDVRVHEDRVRSVIPGSKGDQDSGAMVGPLELRKRDHDPQGRPDHRPPKDQAQGLP